MTEFIKNAKGLTKNPLGIIALFISLIYGFACLVLGLTSDTLSSANERLPLIWFIIVFPIIILLAFVYLVVNHHEKLYSPSDFRNDEGFIDAIDRRRILEKRKEEAKELQNAQMNTANIRKFEMNFELNDEDDVNDVEFEEITEKADKNEVEMKNIVVEDTIDFDTIIKKYGNSEEWVAKKLSLKYNLSFKPNRKLATPNGNFELDALGQDNKRLFVVETKFWTINKADANLKQSIKLFIERTEKLKQVIEPNREFRIIVALVFDNLKAVNLVEFIEFIKAISPDVFVEFFEYSELQERYG